MKAQSVEAISHSCTKPVLHSEAELFLLCRSVPDSLSLQFLGDDIVTQLTGSQMIASQAGSKDGVLFWFWF